MFVISFWLGFSIYVTAYTVGIKESLVSFYETCMVFD